MTTISQKELRKLSKQGYKVVESKKPEKKPEEKLAEVTREAVLSNLAAIFKIVNNSNENNVKILDEFRKQTGKIAEAVKGETPWTEIKMTPVRDKQGLIKDITIRRVK